MDSNMIKVLKLVHALNKSSESIFVAMNLAEQLPSEGSNVSKLLTKNCLNGYQNKLKELENAIHEGM